MGPRGRFPRRQRLCGVWKGKSQPSAAADLLVKPSVARETCGADLFFLQRFF